MTHHRIIPRPRLLGIAAAAAVLLSTLAVFSGPAQALASGAPGAVLSVRVMSDEPVAPDASTAPASAVCAPAPDKFNRTELCFLKPVKVVVLRNRTPVGSASFTVTHSLQLNPRGRDYTEHVSIGGVHLVGEAGGIHVALADGCGITCTPTGNNFPVGETLRSGLHGTLTFHDSIGMGRKQALTNHYTWLFVKAGFTTGSVTYDTPISYRCDFMISSVPGCVFPEFIPVMTSMLRLPHIAANIRRIQARGLHLGKLGDGHPLHRNANVAQQNRNRRAVCGRRVVGPPPPGKSCDEYPFASTKEGGTAVPANSRGTAFVPTHEQDSQRGFISSFYQRNRILDGDAFWVFV